MKKILPIITIAILSAFSWSCGEDDGDESPVYIIADWSTDSVLGGRHFFFKMEMFANQGTLDKLTMTAVDGYNGKRDLETIDLNGGTKKKYEYDYLLPIFPDSVIEMELRALVRNSEGEEWTGTKKLKVYAADYTLNENELTLVEKPAPGKYNGLYFSAGKPEPINTDVVTEAERQHVVIYYDKDKEGNAASKGIKTNTANIRMSRVNSFDYANAKYNSVLNTFSDRYSVGEVYTSIGDLKENDVILVGTIDESSKKAVALGVIKVYAVPETNDQATDIYRFGVKGMGR